MTGEQTDLPTVRPDIILVQAPGFLPSLDGGPPTLVFVDPRRLRRPYALDLPPPAASTRPQVFIDAHPPDPIDRGSANLATAIIVFLVGAPLLGRLLSMVSLP